MRSPGCHDTCGCHDPVQPDLVARSPADWFQSGCAGPLRGVAQAGKQRQPQSPQCDMRACPCMYVLSGRRSVRSQVRSFAWPGWSSAAPTRVRGRALHKKKYLAAAYGAGAQGPLTRRLSCWCAGVRVKLRLTAGPWYVAGVAKLAAAGGWCAGALDQRISCWEEGVGSPSVCCAR